MSPHTLHKSTIPPVSVEQTHIHYQTQTCIHLLQTNRYCGGGKPILTGECAGETTGPFSHCWVAVGWRWYRCYLSNLSTAYFRKLKNHFWGDGSSLMFAAMFQGSDLLKGNTLWRWGLRVGGRRLGLVSTWGAARTRTGTSRWAGVQDNTSWRNRDEEKLSFPIIIWVTVLMRSVGESWAMLHFDALNLLGRLSLHKHTLFGQLKFDLINNLAKNNHVTALQQRHRWPEYLSGTWTSVNFDN